MSESSINDEIPVCKCENGPVKSDIFYKLGLTETEFNKR